MGSGWKGRFAQSGPLSAHSPTVHEHISFRREPAPCIQPGMRPGRCRVGLTHLGGDTRVSSYLTNAPASEGRGAQTQWSGKASYARPDLEGTDKPASGKGACSRWRNPSGRIERGIFRKPEDGCVVKSRGERQGGGRQHRPTAAVQASGGPGAFVQAMRGH